MVQLWKAFARAQLLSVLAFCLLLGVVLASKDFDPDSGYLYVDEDTPGNTVEDLGSPDSEIHQRWKRDTTDGGWSLKGLPGAGYLKKLNKILKEADNLPPSIKEAIRHGDFSNVTADQVRSVNVSVLEYIPPKMFQKMNSSVIETIIKLFVDFNRPNALGRLVEVVGAKLNPMSLLDKIPRPSEASQPNEASSVLLYSALNSLGDKDGISEQNVRRLGDYGLLKYVPEEQLMKVKDGNAAKSILERLYNNPTTADKLEEDDKSLVFKLIETQHGPAKNWTDRVLQEVVGSKYTKFIPAAFLKQMNRDTISSSITSLRASEYDSALQAKTVTDSYLEKAGITKTAEGAPQGSTSNIQSLVQQLGKLAAFVNPATTKDQGILGTIVDECNKMNLPAPLKAITSILQSKFKGNKLNGLVSGDFKSIKPEVLRQSPPEIIGKAMDTQALSDLDLQDISRIGPKADQGFFGSPFFKGLISQLTSYAVSYFRERSNLGLKSLPAAFLGGLSMTDIQKMNSHELEETLAKLKQNPDSLDETQKALLLKRLLHERLVDGGNIPPELSCLRPRAKNSQVNAGDIDGLLSDSELRLAYGEGKPITATILERDPKLVGTLTPKQVNAIKLEEIPGVLAAVRRSKDGPQPQTLQALRDQFVAYLRLKSDDYEDSNDKKLLKYVTAAEVSKLPASVLAYFIDPRQTSTLPPAVRKEILVALGEMSVKDRALIPGKTREEIITQGLDALDSILGADAKYDVPELAAIGSSVTDLHPKNIEKLTPVAVEQSLDRIQGTAEEEGGLKQRACLNDDQKKAWRNKILENYGNPKSWDPATVTSLCCILPILNEDDLLAIAKESLVTCQCASDNAPPAHLAELKKSLDRACEHQLGKPDNSKKVFEKVKVERAIDMNDLESQIFTGMRRRKRAHDHSQHHNGHALSCYVVRMAGNGAAFDVANLETLNGTEMKNCLYELGSVKLEPAQAKVLWNKLAHASTTGTGSHAQHGAGVISPADLRAAGYILSGITLHEVDELSFTNSDVVAAFGRPLGFSKTLLEKIAKHLQKHKNTPKDQFTTVDLILANNILCGFEIATLSRIVPETFADALPILRNLDPSCELTRLSTLVNIAQHQRVYGPLDTWTASDVRGAGILVTGLTADAKKIPAESFLGLSPTVAAALNENTLSALSPEQLGFIPRFSAQAMTEPQLNALTNDGREALQSTIRGPLVTDTSVSLQISISTLVTLFLTAILARRVL